MRRWRVRVRSGHPAPGGLAFAQETVDILPRRYWTRRGAWAGAARWKADYESRRLGIRSTVVVDVVHQRELES